ncbi:MOSC N-terminal beta barrel domain-containing protein [Paraburkholderia sp.]|uniref:MOSC domain-containing protein n=1 Tax=Paraburkholderia sp. TaxID=1926495 RepID=UPI00239B1137|nr:MOSC N-terminal beta barrel domain-containing protein [Paraburkholderia sp.]MDE1184305.1 MOSC N-terminal beta barrel domain-containing protein [Paraburkholderia sp.]
MPTLTALYVYPVKSCAAIALNDAHLLANGLAYDRNWMIVEPDGTMVTQRTVPRLALIRVEIGERDLILSVPADACADAAGLAPLHTPLTVDALVAGHGTQHRSVTIWGDTVDALDTGDACAQWLSTYLGMTVRLVRFDPAAERIASRKWTGELRAPTQFVDGFPLLVANTGSLDDLNQRLTAKGAPAIPMDRFRANLVISGWDAFEEDFIETLTIVPATHDGEAVELRFVKPCSRCPMPTIDQATGAPDPAWPNEPTDTLVVYRRDPRVNDAPTFGQNAVIVSGVGARLAVGQQVEAEIAFGD